METYRDPPARAIGGVALLAIFLGILGMPIIWRFPTIGFGMSTAGLLLAIFSLASPSRRRVEMVAPLVIALIISVATLVWNFAVAFGWADRWTGSWLS